MKRRGLCAILALLLLLLAACGGAATGGATSDSAANGAADMVAEDAAAMDVGATGESADFSAVRENAKLILNADLTLETQDYEASCTAIEQMTAAAGGYIESSGMSGEKGERRASYTLRVPQEKFESFFTQLGDTCHVVSSNRWSDDVTERYTDIETRLATLQTKHERLLALLEKATEMTDIIDLENALADCEYEIDSLTGEMRHYDSLVDFSTFNVTLREVQTLTAVSEGTGFGAQVAQAARQGAAGLKAAVSGMILLVVMLWPVLALLVIAGVVFWRVCVYRRRKAAQPPKDDPPQDKTG